MSSTSIKDTIHGYIELDPFERLVVDSPWFQRLRRVRQNDVASYVYPTMLTTRFEHSLGAMHLAGECLTAALGDTASEENVDVFVKALERELSQVLKIRLPRAVATADFARRCARLYGALHDIGHPPYSHLIEACYTPEQIGITDSESEHWHERNGAEIVANLMPRTLGVIGVERDLLKCVAHLATKEVSSPALAALKRLVDAVIDVDRMDFVRRDGRNSGSEFGVYDLRRLVGSFRVYVEDGKSPSVILIRPLHKALSAIESLIQERHKIYRWVLFHHRVMQSRALMRYALQQTAKDKSFDPRQFQAANYVPPPSDKKFGHVLLGDGAVERHLDKHLKRLRARRRLTPAETRLLTALRVLVLRESLGISLWKRTDDYSSESNPESFESRLRTAFRTVSPSPPHARLLEAYGSYANWVANVLGRPANRSILREVTTALNRDKKRAEWFLLEIPDFKRTGDDRILVSGKAAGVLRPEYLSNVSSVARAVDVARRDDVHLFAFCFTPEQVNHDREHALKITGRGAVADAVAAVYRRSETHRAQFETLER